MLLAGTDDKRLRLSRKRSRISSSTIYREGHLVSIKYTDYKDGILQVIQSKTGVALKIRANSQLDGLIKRSVRTGVMSKHLVHKNPAHKRHEYMAKKDHWAMVTPEMLSREFAKLREKAGIEPNAGMNPPTFHEIRSLGGRLLEEQGHSKEFIQALMGHTDQAMTAHYLEDGSIDWQMAEAALKL
ncbi:MAG: tyrosine-type recombinase/integrase [Gammaproteobacteria bacterium]